MSVTINTDLMRETFAYIEAHPEEHNQDHWVDDEDPDFCGTTRCFAGTAIHLSEDYVIRSERNVGGWTNFWCETKAGQRENFSAAGRDLLGLTDEQAEHMFMTCGDLDDLYEAAKEFTGIDFRDQVIADA